MPTVSLSSPRVAPPPDSEEHKKCLDYSLACINEAEQPHQQRVLEWQENLRAFFAMPSRTARRKKDWQSDLRNPYIAEQVLTLQPRLVDPHSRFDFIPQQAGTTHEQLIATEQLIDHLLWRDKWLLTQAMGTMPLQIFGISWTKVGYQYRSIRRTVRSTQQEMSAGAAPFHEQRLVTDDRFTHDVCHPYDVLADPVPYTFEKLRYLCHITYLTDTQLLARERRVDADGNETGFYDNVQDIIGTAGRQRETELKNELPDYVNARRKAARNEVIEVWSKERDRLYTICNRKVVLRDIRNPRMDGEIPFAPAITNPDLIQMHGQSMVTWMRAQQEMLHLIENQKLDNTRLTMDSIMLVRDTIENLDDFIHEPGAVWPVQDPNDVMFPQLPQPQMASEADIESIRGRMQAIGGLTYLGGSDPNSQGVNNDTATGLMALREEANRRVDFSLSLVRSLCYERLVDLSLVTTQQLMTNPVNVLAPGYGAQSGLMEVSPQDIASRCWVRSRQLTDTLSKTVKLQNGQQLIQTMVSLMQLGLPVKPGKVLNVMPALDYVAEAMERTGDDFLQDAPQQDPNAQGGPSPIQRLIESINYKDLGSTATPLQQEMLAMAGIQTPQSAQAQFSPAGGTPQQGPPQPGQQQLPPGAQGAAEYANPPASAQH